jgi:Holliday junction resolvase-like predicted endonuclease
LTLAKLNKEFLLEILKYTKESDVLLEDVLLSNTFLPSHTARDQLNQLAVQRLISREGNRLKISPIQKVDLAVQALRLGLTLGSVCRYLTWQEFEKVTAYALEKNNYHVLAHLRVKMNGEWSEIDLLAVQNWLALMIDCKHWKTHLNRSKVQRIVDMQLKRLEALSSPKNLKKIEVELKMKLPPCLKAVPVVVTLLEVNYLVYRGVPIVPISKFGGFLNEVLGCWELFSFKSLT